jgi:N-acylneuraminate cytidylyltransferase
MKRELSVVSQPLPTGLERSSCIEVAGIGVTPEARSILAIIPARGGSKGIPRKNVRMLAGKPLLAHSIEHALAARCVDRVVVSTDDDEIAAVGLQWGAEVVRRPAEISGDTASSESALLHVLDHLRDAEQYEPDLVVFLQATSPIRPDGCLDEAVATLGAENADALLSVGPLHGFVWRLLPSGPVSFNYDFEHRPRRQDAPEDVIENGSFYVFRPDGIRATGNRLSGKIAVHRMRAVESFQIDEPGDFELMEALLRGGAGVSNTPTDLASAGLLALDFDGVMTDDRVVVDEHGVESVCCNRGDGMGIARLRRAGVPVVVISTETNPVVTARCRKLAIECVQSCEDKAAALQACARRLGVSRSQVVYVGNDVNDLPAMAWAGVPVAVADARPEVRAAAGWVTGCRGGAGAVREVCEMILQARRSALEGG